MKNKNFEKKQFKTVNAALKETNVSYLENPNRKEAVIEVAEVIGIKQLQKFLKVISRVFVFSL